MYIPYITYIGVGRKGGEIPLAPACYPLYINPVRDSWELDKMELLQVSSNSNPCKLV
jgi:hypothetical protein